MSDSMRGPVKVTHWTRHTGYIKSYGPVCGIAEKVDGWRSVEVEELKPTVTCEHCLYWLWEQEQPAKKMDVSNAVDDRIVSMQFRNGSLSAHDAETAIQRGIREGLAKVASDFRATKPELERMVADGVQAALQRSSVRTNLIGIHKIAEDEIDDEYQKNGIDDEIAEDRKREMREVLEAVLDERGLTGAGVGTQFVQNVYTPDALSPAEIYRQGKKFEPQNITVNVDSQVNPYDFKDMVKNAIEEYEADTLDNYNEEETALMQKAVASVFVSDQFQELMKKLVKVSLDERDQEAHRRALEWQIAWSDRYLNLPTKVLHDLGDVVEGSDHNAQKISIELNEPVPVVHYRRLYRTETACYLNAGAEDLECTIQRSRVTCHDCKMEASIN